MREQNWYVLLGSEYQASETWFHNSYLHGANGA